MTIVERPVPISLDMFLPKEDRPAAVNLRMAYLMGDFFGRGRVRLQRGIQQGGVLPNHLVKEIDQYVFGAIRRVYRLPDRIDPQEFYIQQQKQAIGTIRYFGELLPELAQDLELKDEVSLLSDSPSDLFRFLSRPPRKIDSVLAYEIDRHPLLTIISGMHNANILNGKLRTLLSRIHNVFNQKLFEGLEGAGTKFVLKSIHDDETNEVVGFADENRRISPTAHLKHVPFTVRSIRRNGLVYTSPRKKDDRVANVKIMAKASEHNGIITMDDDVEDSIGMMFVLMGNHSSLAELADQTISVIKSEFRVAKVGADNKVGTDHGQSQTIEFERRKIWFYDPDKKDDEMIPVPLELIFMDRKNYLNSRLEVGVRDPETGLYMGGAHDLFALRRGRRVFRTPFPEKIFPVDSDRAFANRSKLKAQELRDMYRLAA